MNKDNLAPYYFHQGTNFYSYEYLGCNCTHREDEYVYSFRVWAPNADSVALVSDFSGWDSPLKLNKITDKGIYELIYTSPDSLEGAAYKFVISRKKRSFYKADPYARYSKGGSDGASVVFTKREFVWEDSAFLSYRKNTFKKSETGDTLPIPINIYEVHLGSFLRHESGEYYTYREMADILPSYVKSLGYTHVEFLPLSEFPYDGSWGYQVCAFYAPTSRFGTPDDFKYLINELHKSGLSVILDWVPAHFPKDEWGLYEFDGAPLYEYQGSDRMESGTWGTRFFDLGREEVQSFLISNALYYLREFHIDGLRVDAVASMIYLDYDRKEGEWIPNAHGGRENLEAIAFLKKLNSAIHEEFSDVLMIAEESSAFYGVTKPVSEGGLGFDLKWNMGFANDFYDYIETDSVYRKYKHSALTFPIMYCYQENYVLPISHDEVVHGKKSFIDKFYGSYSDKFKEMRAALMFIMTFPGKKHLFMGTEFAQFREWDYENSLEWFMLDYEAHRETREYVKALNNFYLENSQLWQLDFNPRGFEWVLADESDKNIVFYKRFSYDEEPLLVIVNFSGSDESVEYHTEKEIKLSKRFESDPSRKAQISFSETEEKKTFNIKLPSYFGIILSEKTYDNTIIL
jgi:1,4-alpha-glucan branching enzyme